MKLHVEAQKLYLTVKVAFQLLLQIKFFVIFTAIFVTV